MSKQFSYSEGSYGSTVRVFARPGRANIYIAYWDSKLNRIVPTSLGHADKELARRQCRDLSDALRLGITIAPSEADNANDTAATDSSIEREEATRDPWEDLFERYKKDVGQHKKGSGPSEDARRARVWRAFAKKEGFASPADMDQDGVNRFARLRLKGNLEVPGVRLRPRARSQKNRDAVKPRTVEADVVYLLSVLNWAEGKRVNGRPLLERPVKLHVPKGLKKGSANRPVATTDDVRDLLRVADDVDPTGLFRCFVHVVDELGWRVTGACNIRASDVNFRRGDAMPYGSIRKNAEVDKEGVDDEVPLSRRARAAITRALHLRDLSRGSDKHLFDSRSRPGKPWSRWHVRDLINRAEKFAGIEHIGGIHAMRRKWATERKDHPKPDVMKAGGWVDGRSLDAYMQADAETTYEVVSRRTRRVRRRSDRLAA